MWGCNKCYHENQQGLHKCQKCGKDKPVCNVQSEITFQTKYDINTSSTSMTVKWRAFQRKEVVCSYQVKYRLTTETRFTCIDLEEGKEVEITGLKPNTKYEFKVFWIGDDGNNNIMFEGFITTAEAKIRQNNGENAQCPSKWMRDIVPSSTTLMVSWKDSSKENSDIIGYLAKYRISTEKSQFAEAHSKGTAREIEICGLKPNTTYNVTVSWVNGQGETYFMFADLAMTTKSKSLSLIDKDTFQMGRDKKPPIVYLLKPINIEQIGENIQLRICDMIQGYDRQLDSNKEKTILLLGATGTGKSTFIDALINYVAEVSYSEDHRFSIVSKTEEEELREKDQTGPQTSSITMYRIPELKGLKVKHKINIIDTPGFNDTRDFDEKITTQIKHLFEKTLEHVDAIFLVLPICTFRLREGLGHDFKSILELFGKDVEKNVFLIMTHDDGGSPEGCLSVVRSAGIPYIADKQVFRFNNSNLFAKNKFGSRVWEERTKTFSKMFQVLENVPRTAVETRKKVMRTRDKL